VTAYVAATAQTMAKAMTGPSRLVLVIKYPPEIKPAVSLAKVG
jgi:hypothetical protein